MPILPDNFAQMTQAQKSAYFASPQAQPTPVAPKPTLQTINQTSGVIEQQRGLPGQSLQRLGTTTLPTTITGTSIAPPAVDLSKQVATPSYQQPYPVAGLNATPPATPEITMTEPETERQRRINELMGLNEQNQGEAAYRAEQENQAGLPDMLKTQRDLSSRLTALKNEANAIPLQLQQDATGRGITAGGLAPIQTAALRNNAIQALSTSSMLEATRGNITTAQDLADRAVEQKYGPIKEKIATAKANLDLIINSPEYSLADKNRAIKQQAIQNTKAKEAERNEADSKEAQALLIKLISNNPNIDATTLETLRKTTNVADLAVLASKNGLDFDKQALPSSAQEYNFAVDNGYKGSYTQYQDEDANRKRSIAAAGVSNSYGMNSKETAIFNSIVDKQNKSPLVAANDRAVILKDVTTALEKDPTNAALQVSFIYSMIQALDTYQSAVREGEIGLLSSTQGVGEKIANLPSKIQNGNPLSESKIKEYIAVANTLSGSIANAANLKRNAFSAQARIAGVGTQFDEYQSIVSGQGLPSKDSLGINAGTAVPGKDGLGLGI